VRIKVEKMIAQVDGRYMNWNVLHVRPRCEKKMAEYCTLHQIPTYLPMRQETKVYQRRKVIVSKPLFPGYVFADFPPTERLLVQESRKLVRRIEVPDQVSFANELEQVRKALLVDATLGATPELVTGQPVRIISGPFQGLEGVVSSVQGMTRVVLNVDMIGQSVRLEAEPHMLEPREPPAPRPN
jgi:transcription antitermination factor NusG